MTFFNSLDSYICAMCHMSHVNKNNREKNLESDGASRWRVFHKHGLPSLVFSCDRWLLCAMMTNTNFSPQLVYKTGEGGLANKQSCGENRK